MEYSNDNNKYNGVLFLDDYRDRRGEVGYIDSVVSLLDGVTRGSIDEMVDEAERGDSSRLEEVVLLGADLMRHSVFFELTVSQALTVIWLSYQYDLNAKE